MATESLIYCIVCDRNVRSFLVQGWNVLPEPAQNHLRHSFFWKCPYCRNFVGTHQVKKNDLAPLGPISSKKMRARQKIIRERIKSILELKKDLPDAKEKLYGWLGRKLFHSDFRIEWIISNNTYQQTLKLLDLLK